MLKPIGDLKSELAEFGRHCGPNVQCRDLRMFTNDAGFVVMACDVVAHKQTKTITHRMHYPDSPSERMAAARECGRAAAAFSNLVRP